MMTVRVEADYSGADCGMVEVIGVYRSMMLPRSARPGSPLFESDRAVLELRDGHRLALETHEAGIRSAEERRAFGGREVRIRGTIRRYAQLWGGPEESAIVMDAVVDIADIELGGSE